MAVSRAFSFKLNDGSSVFLLNATNYGLRPGGTNPWVSDTIYAEDVRMPDGWLSFNRAAFAALDTYDIRVMGRDDPTANWAMLLPPLTEVSSSAIAISAAGSDFVQASGSISQGLSTIAIPLTPEIRLEIYDMTNGSGGAEFVMAAWMLSDV